MAMSLYWLMYAMWSLLWAYEETGMVYVDTYLLLRKIMYGNLQHLSICKKPKEMLLTLQQNLLDFLA
jgi:hypothetical protein